MRTRLLQAFLAVVILFFGFPARGEPEARSLFLRFRPATVGEVYARVYTSVAAAPWRRDRGVFPAEADRDAALRVAKLERSDWIEVPGLEAGGTITLAFNPVPIDSMAGQVELATRADEQTIVRRIDFAEPGNLLTLIVPADALRRPAGIVTQRELIARRLKLAKKLRDDMLAPARPRDELIGPVTAVPVSGPPTLASNPAPASGGPASADAASAADVGEADPAVAAAMAAARAAPGEQAPPAISLIAPALCGYGVTYSDPRLRADELETLRLQGFTGLAPVWTAKADKPTRAFGRERGLWIAPGHFPAAEFVALAPGQHVGRGERTDPATLSLVDALVRLDLPPSTTRSAASPSSPPGGKSTPLSFRAYLAARGLKPADFAVPSFDRVNDKPDHEKLLEATHNEDPALARAAVNLLVWTTRYHAYLASHALSQMTRPDALADLAGRDAAVVADFVDRPLVIGAGLSPGPLGPELDAAGREVEVADFWPDDATRDRWRRFAPRLHLGSAYLLDLLRGSASPESSLDHAWAAPAQATAYLSLPRDGAALGVQSMLALAHGARAVQFFDFGPLCVRDAAAIESEPAAAPAAEDESSAADAPASGDGAQAAKPARAGARVAAVDQAFASRAAAMIRLTRDLARARELLIAGAPAPRQVAILHVADAELWNASWPIAQDRRMLHHALLSEQYEADVITDQAAMTRDLAGYRVIYVTDTQVPAAVLEKLRLWVKDGGRLCLGAMAATQDEAGRPAAGIAELIGAEAAERDSIDPGAAAEALTFQPRALASGGKPLREASVSLALRACRFEKAPADRVVASFGDGAPAILSRPLGKGEVISLAFSPGLSVLHQLRQSASGEVELPTNVVAAVTYACRAAGIVRAVEASAPVGCASLIAGEAGGALLLADARPAGVRNLTLRVAMADVRSVESLRHGPLTFATAPGRVVITLPALEQSDIILLRR